MEKNTNKLQTLTYNFIYSGNGYVGQRRRRYRRSGRDQSQKAGDLETRQTCLGTSSIDLPLPQETVAFEMVLPRKISIQIKEIGK